MWAEVKDRLEREVREREGVEEAWRKGVAGQAQTQGQEGLEGRLRSWLEGGEWRQWDVEEKRLGEVVKECENARDKVDKVSLHKSYSP